MRARRRRNARVAGGVQATLRLDHAPSCTELVGRCCIRRTGARIGLQLCCRADFRLERRHPAGQLTAGAWPRPPSCVQPATTHCTRLIKGAWTARAHTPACLKHPLAASPTPSLAPMACTASMLSRLTPVGARQQQLLGSTSRAAAQLGRRLPHSAARPRQTVGVQASAVSAGCAPGRNGPAGRRRPDADADWRHPLRARRAGRLRVPAACPQLPRSPAALPAACSSSARMCTPEEAAGAPPPCVLC